MNAIDKALRDITFSIPAEIRQWIFGVTPIGGRLVPISERQQIRHAVIDARVLPDCDLVGGEQVVVPLERMPYQELPDGSALYQIPSERLQGRRIQVAYSVSSGSQLNEPTGRVVRNDSLLTNAAQKIIDAHSFTGNDTTNRVRVVGENVVLVEERLTLNQLYLRCVLTNDANLSNFSPRAFPYFSKLCIMATKAHIYNEGVLRLDAGVLQGGVQLGKFREIIDSYADSNTLYEEYLTTEFTNISFQSDRESFTRHLKSITGGNLL